MGFPILTVITLLPVLGAVLVGVLGREDTRLIKGTGLAVMLVNFAVSLGIYGRFRSGYAEIQLREFFPVLSDYGIAYNAGVDGISLFLVLLSTLLMPLALLGAWQSIQQHVKAFVVAMLLLEAAMIGTFVQLNLFFFYVFWEAMLIPMVLIIGVWGSGDRVKSALKFFLYTAVGSLLMLAAIVVLYRESAAQLGTYTLNYHDLLRLDLTYHQQFWLFGAFALAFAIKVPLFPLHTWLPDAHTDAPTPGSVVLAGVLLKLGSYGLVRYALPLFGAGAQAWAPWMVGLAVVGIVFAALVAWVQADMKKLIAYSSVSHMGFVVLGLFVMNKTAATGAVLQMVSHGISTGALFLLVGMIYERRHTRAIDAYGGIAATVPWLAACFLVATLSSIGLPGLNGFVGEFLVLLGTFGANADRFLATNDLNAMLPVLIAVTGVVLSAVYMLTLYLRVFYGPIRHEVNRKLPDLSLREWSIMLPLIALMVGIGVRPSPLLNRIEPSVQLLYERRLGTEERRQVDPDRVALRTDAVVTPDVEREGAR